MRYPITIYHWFMWHCSIFYTVLFFAIFNNLLAFLATAIIKPSSLTGPFIVYHTLNCSIKFLNANLPYLNEWNSKTHNKSFHVCVFLWLHSHFASTRRCKNRYVRFFTSPALPVAACLCAQTKLHSGSLPRTQNTTVWKS